MLTPIRAAMTTSGANTARFSTALACARRALSAQAGSGGKAGSGLANVRAAPRVRSGTSCQRVGDPHQDRYCGGKGQGRRGSGVSFIVSGLCYGLQALAGAPVVLVNEGTGGEAALPVAPPMCLSTAPPAFTCPGSRGQAGRAGRPASGRTSRIRRSRAATPPRSPWPVRPIRRS